MLNILKKIFKHRHRWHNIMCEGLYLDGWDYCYKCRCGAIKRKYMIGEEEILENKGDE